MLGDIGEILPLATGVALSPLPIVAVVLLLMSPTARQAGIGFALGWTGGLAGVVLVAGWLSRLAPGGGAHGPSPLVTWAKLLLGCVLVFLAVKQWRQRPAPGTDPPLPKWAAATGSMGAGGAARLAVLLAAVNPKNLVLAFTAGVQIGQADHPWVAGIVFLVIASSIVAGLVILYQVRPDGVSSLLEPARTWLVANNAIVMAGLFLVMGATVIGKALAGF